MPFNLFDFAALLFEAVPLIPDTGRLLVVGAGPGPEMVIARDVYGMDVAGIEILEPLAALGRDAGLPIQTASEWTGYEKYDAIWLNRPRRDRGLEAMLEARIWREMAEGAVAICANTEHPPPESWFIINDSWSDLIPAAQRSASAFSASRSSSRPVTFTAFNLRRALANGTLGGQRVVVIGDPEELAVNSETRLAAKLWHAREIARFELSPASGSYSGKHRA